MTSQRFQRVASAMHHALSLMLVVFPLISGLILFQAGTNGVLALAPVYVDVIVPPGILAWVGIICLLAVMVGLLMGLMWHVRALFGLYAKGQVLTAPPANEISYIGKFLFASAVFGVLADPLFSILLTSGNPAGQRTFALMLSSGDFAYAIGGGLLWLIAWVMQEAVRMADDSARII